jgi:hypothetical protein
MWAGGHLRTMDAAGQPVPKTFRSIINTKAKVRITGWLMWDYEHKEQLGNTRRTLWEVHPIHSIQVLHGNRWVAL